MECMAPAPHPPTRRQTAKVLRLLHRQYGPVEIGSDPRGIETLVATILSQNTTAGNRQAGMKQLRRRFASWEAVADAPVEEIAACIRICGLGNVRAPRIRAILQQIRQQRGRLDISHLADMPPDEAYAWLTGLHGVGPKTALCVLMFAFNAAVFPVDTHILRIAKRLGWLGAKVPLEEAHEHLSPAIAPGNRAHLHVQLIRHGRKICKARTPQCEWCILREICPTGQASRGA